MRPISERVHDFSGDVSFVEVVISDSDVQRGHLDEGRQRRVVREPAVVDHGNDLRHEVVQHIVRNLGRVEKSSSCIRALKCMHAYYSKPHQALSGEAASPLTKGIIENIWAL